MKFYTNSFIEYIYKEIYNYCWLLLITGLNLKSKSFRAYRVTLYICQLPSDEGTLKFVTRPCHTHTHVQRFLH